MDKLIQVLDIRDDVCPMTFVKTRLLIEKMSAGDVATVLLRGEEPIENVPASVAELGHTIVELTPLQADPDQTDQGGIRPGDMQLIIRKD
jgi:TusA-related sulfurtransferase